MSNTSTGPEIAPTGSIPTEEFDALIYVLSHDLRASVRAMAEVPLWIGEDLQSEGYAVSDTMQDNLSLLGVHAKRLDQMLLDLLIYSRVGRLQKIKGVSLTVAFSQAMKECSVPIGFEVKTDFQQDEIEFGDADIVVLMKAFLSNAIKHHDRPSGQLHIGTKRHEDTVIMRFEDDGPGIPEAYRERVFDVMTTLRPRDEVEGSGMGLALAKKIATYYGGDVRLAEAQNSRGSTFFVTLPLVVQRPKAEN